MESRIKIFVYAVIAIVGAAVIAGFFAVGSPQNKRLQNFDERRIQDLQMLQNEIINYWQSKGVLPARLALLNDSLRGITIPRDPQTGAEYEYAVKDRYPALEKLITENPRSADVKAKYPELAAMAEENLTFELCATFSLPMGRNSNGKTDPVPAGLYYGGQANWEHGAGRTCFDRTIDKDFYKPINHLPIK